MKIIILTLVVLLSSCATERPKGKTEAEILYKEAKELVDDGHFLMASEKLNTVRSQYPYSFFATGAELLQADILFEQESFVESAAAYILFRDFHPRHPKIDYVVGRIAESYFRQLPDVHDRDLSATSDAIKYYEELLFKYPKSEYAKNAQDKIKKMKEMLAAKERYIADFYYKTKVYESARYRYKDILKGVLFDAGLKDYYIERVLMSSLLNSDKDDCLNDYLFYSSEASNTLRPQIEQIRKSCEKIVVPVKEDEEDES
jgi:outer membrane protein assembly factor BamD